MKGFSFRGAGFMPHSSHTQQTKTHEAAAGYSPRLCNDDLAPTRDQ
ncbi:hypothetical protein, partial [Klebsiella pneumoniae]